ncbi:MAG: YicC family protein [Verrucomicrobia bacterium]|nr:YicC family protein [Verrucomicrobiota bacterium]
MGASSMTGFGRAELNLPGVRLSVEIASVNQKNLQVAIYGPDVWSGLEAVASAWIRARLQRGKVTARVTQSTPTAVTDKLWDAEATKRSFKELEHLAQSIGVSCVPPSLDLVLKLAEARRGNQAILPDFAVVEAQVCLAFDAALNAILKMRAEEGRALSIDLQRRIAAIEKMVLEMMDTERLGPVRHRDALLRRLKEAGLSIDVADDRVLKELALFADRSDITEEIVRLKSHVSQFKAELESPNCGRKLDFLVQELLREVNTIGSKASEILTTKLVLEVKTEIERIREQVQNLE